MKLQKNTNLEQICANDMFKCTYITSSSSAKRKKTIVTIFRNGEGIMITSMKHKQSLFMSAMIHAAEINTQ